MSEEEEMSKERRNVKNQIERGVLKAYAETSTPSYAMQRRPNASDYPDMIIKILELRGCAHDRVPSTEVPSPALGGNNRVSISNFSCSGNVHTLSNQEIRMAVWCDFLELVRLVVLPCRYVMRNAADVKAVRRRVLGRWRTSRVCSLYVSSNSSYVQRFHYTH
jgi:hypothetical protein